MRIIARKAGRCYSCGAQIAKGATIEWRKVGRRGFSWHTSCLPGGGGGTQSAPAAPAAPPPTLLRMDLSSPLDLVRDIPDEHRNVDTDTASSVSCAVAVDRIRNGDTRPDILAAIERGRDAGRRAAAPLVSRITWDRQHAGAFPSVPHYLGGDDRTMMIPAVDPSASAPLRVWVSFSIWSEISEERATERAGRIAGLVDAIATTRPVTLTAFSVTVNSRAGGDENPIIGTWPLDPRDPPRLAPMIGTAACRGIWIRWKRAHGDVRNSIIEDRDYLRRMLGAAPDDVIIGPMVDHEGKTGDLSEALSQLAAAAGS